MDFLKGKKTYIAGAIVFLLGGLRALNVIDDHALEVLTTLFGSLGLMALRSALPE